MEHWINKYKDYLYIINGFVRFVTFGEHCRNELAPVLMMQTKVDRG